jgi:hypothetical protein
MITFMKFTGIMMLMLVMMMWCATKTNGVAIVSVFFSVFTPSGVDFLRGREQSEPLFLSFLSTLTRCLDGMQR